MNEPARNDGRGEQVEAQLEGGRAGSGLYNIAPVTGDSERWLLHLLFGLLGLSAWNVTIGLFTQLPLLIPASPNHAQLASLMDVATNIGNLPMLVFVAAQTRTACARRHRGLVLRGTIYAMFALSIAVVAGLCALWRETVLDTSVFVIGFAFCGGVAGNLMMVTVFPFATPFHPVYVASISTGISGHGLLNNLLALMQGVGLAEPRFGFEVYMLLVGIIQLLGLLGFRQLCQRATALAHDTATTKSRPPEGADMELLAEREPVLGREAEVAGSSRITVQLGVPQSAGFLVANQYWTNFTYFLLVALFPYVARDTHTGETKGEVREPSLFGASIHNAVRAA
jgi:hypothetical protein